MDLSILIAKFDSFWLASTAIATVIALLAGYRLSILANIRSAPAAEKYKKSIEYAELSNLLDLKKSNKPVIIVISHRQIDASRGWRPNFASEDVLAMRNIIEMLSTLGYKHTRIMHPNNMTDEDKKHNVISIGGPDSNSYTAATLPNVKRPMTIQFKPELRSPEHFHIRLGDNSRYHSATYDLADSADQLIAKTADMAILLRIKNPLNPSSTVIIMAGIRGIGTWGASDYLRKHQRALNQALLSDLGGAPDRGFLAVVESHYEKYDISRTHRCCFHAITVDN